MKRVTPKDLRVVSKIKKNKYITNSDNRLFPVTSKSLDILQQAEYQYSGFEPLRKKAQRNMRFYTGDQWGDTVQVSINGIKTTMTEKAYLELQGKPALKQNLIRPPLKNILGQFRSSPYKSVVYARNREDQLASEMMTVALESAYQMNDGKERDARKLEEFLITSCAIYETKYHYDMDRQRAFPKFRGVNINRFFCDKNTEDILNEDVKIIGEICDVPLIDLISTYAKTPEQEQALRNIYSSTREWYDDRGAAFDKTRLTNLSFLIPESSSLCRIIKVWVKEGRWALRVHDYADGTDEIREIEELSMIKQYNKEREEMAVEIGQDVPMIVYEKIFYQQWRCYHLSPLGNILFESDNPYKHNTHPYIVKFYPMLNGAVWSMVEDLIDQQKMVNRMVILYDFMISASAKGVLLVPEEALTDDFDIDSIAQEWVKYNGVIKIKTKTAQGQSVDLPKQISANSFNAGITEMINFQMRMMQDIGGVHGAAQGKTPASGTPAALYAQETANAALNILDYVDSFSHFCQKRDYKIIQLIKQYYTEKHYQTLGAKNITESAKWYDPDLIRNIEFENQVSKGTDTPSYRMVVDDLLFQLLQGQFIGIEMFLEHSSLPFADKLLASIKNQQEQMQSTGQIDLNAIQDMQNMLPESTPEQLKQAEQLYNKFNGRGI